MLDENVTSIIGALVGVDEHIKFEANGFIGDIDSSNLSSPYDCLGVRQQ